MATGKITKRAVDAIPAAPAGKRNYLWDDTLKGFGLMVTDTGARSYLIQYRVGGRGSPTRRVTIGKHGSPWTPDRARDRAAELLEQVRRKVDPFEAERQALAAARAELEAKSKAEAEVAKLAFSVIADAYIERAKKTLRRWPEQQRIIDRDLKPAFGTTPLPSISADDINDQLAKVGERGTSAALKAYVALRGIYSYAHDTHRKLFPKSALPFDQVNRPQGGGQRARYLTDAELRAMWKATKVLGWPFGPMYQLLLLTGMRLREVAEGHWSEIDFSEKRWNLPGERTKNGLPHWVHLSSEALAILEDLPRVAGGKGSEDFIFTTNGKTPVSGFGRAKSRLDRAMLAILRNDSIDRGDDPDTIKLTPFVIHDTRRTIARGCQRFGTSPEVTERMLGHVSEVERGLKGTYQVYKHEPERIAATERWATELNKIVSGAALRVVSLRGAA
jgi:integrase